MLRQARDPEALYQFLYLEADFSKGDAAAQRDAGWQSKAQVQAVWDFLYMKWDLPKKDARNKLVELSGKWVSLSHLPEDKTQIDAWFRYFYNSVDLSKQESGQRVFTMMTQEPWRVKDDPKNLEKILKEIYSCSDLSKEKAGQLAAKFNDADQVKAIWKALYNTCDYTKADATRILKEVEDWHWIDDTWIKKQWKKYYTDEDKTKLESQRLIQQELISYAKYTKENKYGHNNEDYSGSGTNGVINACNGAGPQESRSKPEVRDPDVVAFLVSSVPDVSSVKASELAARFHNVQHVRCIWKALTKGWLNMLSCDAARLLRDVEDWRDISDDWITDKIEQYNREQGLSRGETIRRVKLDLIECGNAKTTMILQAQQAAAMMQQGQMLMMQAAQGNRSGGQVMTPQAYQMMSQGQQPQMMMQGQQPQMMMQGQQPQMMMQGQQPQMMTQGQQPQMMSPGQQPQMMPPGQQPQMMMQGQQPQMMMQGQQPQMMTQGQQPQMMSPGQQPQMMMPGQQPQMMMQGQQPQMMMQGQQPQMMMQGQRPQMMMQGQQPQMMTQGQQMMMQGPQMMMR